jgi:hypothetical protein
MMKLLQNANANAAYISSPLNYICSKSLIRSGTFHKTKTKLHGPSPRAHCTE